MLRRQIRSLRAKGVDASESLVDLHLKVATPFAAVVMMLLAVPLATRGTRATSLPAAIGLGFAIGISYFFVVGFSRALGQTGSLPPLVAAWTANAVFAVVAGYYQVAADMTRRQGTSAGASSPARLVEARARRSCTAPPARPRPCPGCRASS